MSKDQDQPSSASTEKRICIGRIAAPHGVRGLVKLLPYGDDPSLFADVTNFKITLKNKLGKYILAEIDGVSDRNASEALKGTELFVDRENLPEIEEEDTFYYEDLAGLPCIDEDGKNVGQVQSVQNYGAGELLDVRLNSGQELLIPFTNDYVPNVSESVTIRNYAALII